jgi:hypothetical protein
MSRVAGVGSRGWFFLSGLRRSGAGAEAEAVISGFEDMTVVGEAIEEGCGHLGVAEHASPLTEAEVGGDDDAGLLVKLGEQMEQQRSA